MAFTYFIESTTAYADQLMNNYYYIGEGHQLPNTQGAAGTITAVHDSYNIGASATAWNNIYCNHLAISDSICSVDKSIYVLIAETTTTDTYTSLTFSGLNGDAVTQYKIYAEIIMSDTAHLDTVMLQINNDDDYNYSMQYLRTPWLAETVSSARSASLGFQVGFDRRNFNIITLYSKTGNSRLALWSCLEMEGETSLENSFLHNLVGIWSNTTSTITSLTFHATDSDYAILTGTSIKIYGRK